MPFVENQRARIYWDERGSGPPIVLIMGLNCSSDVWDPLRADIANSYRTIALDNRGSGRSTAERFTMSLMASDVAAVMDAAGVQKAHIIGASMGGMVAQEFALQYPERVRSLILACTLPGGRYALPTKLGLLFALMWRALQDPKNATEGFIPFLYHPATPRDRVLREVATIQKWAHSRREVLGQVLAILAWHSYDRLPQIKVPTLVLHGESDRFVPIENGKRLASRIPGARLEIIPNASHMLHTDQPELTFKVLQSFLSEVEASEAQPATASRRSGT